MHRMIPTLGTTFALLLLLLAPVGAADGAQEEPLGLTACPKPGPDPQDAVSCVVTTLEGVEEILDGLPCVVLQPTESPPVYVVNPCYQ